MSRYTELMAVMLEEFCEADTFHAVFHRDSRKYLRTDRERIRDQGDAALAFLRKKLARELWFALYEAEQMHAQIAAAYQHGKGDGYMLGYSDGRDAAARAAMWCAQVAPDLRSDPPIDKIRQTTMDGENHTNARNCCSVLGKSCRSCGGFVHCQPTYGGLAESCDVNAWNEELP